MEIAVFGDTGGHAKVFFNSLKELGIDPYAATIPENLQVIHLGDLIHKGFSSDLLVETVDKLIRNNPGQWIQIVGNHELQHLDGVSFWRCSCKSETITLLRKLFSEGLIQIAYGADNIKPPVLEVSASPRFHVGNTSWLFTHAGLSYNWWAKVGKPESAVKTAERLNNYNFRAINTPGIIMNYFGKDAGPIWAVASEEVFPTWIQVEKFFPAPFSQMHGHTNAFDFSRNAWYAGANRALKAYRQATKLNPETKASITDIGNQSLLVSIDPCYGTKAYGEKQPYVLLETLSF